MENSETKGADSSQCVRVAVNIRPLITSELMVGCTDCISVVPGEPQIQIGSHSFTYDYVYGSMGSPSSTIYEDCVAPLVEALFNGYNATVLAYGQTGSGKTYTMGTNYTGEGSSFGIIPKVMETIFKRVGCTKENTEFLIRVSFIEIFKEEVFDLLDLNSMPKNEGAASSKASGPARVPIQIRETVNGGITLAGVTEAEVRSKEEMALYLARGSLSRATGSTNMNSQSSRSHAIFTITMDQKKICSNGTPNDDIGDEILCAKLHLVDLAGSERAKRTGADGMRLKEGIHINKGLLALGNVISALGDDKKRKEGGHVPYRDSKLTRLLQDSLGGNSKTVMIACVSPADTNAEETLNTLKYANRARNIQNKAVINRDPMAAQLQRMRNQIEQLQSELLFYRGDGIAPYEELQILKRKVSLLEASNLELQRELQDRQFSFEHLTQRALDAQVEKDKLIMKIELARSGKSWDEVDSNLAQDHDLLKNHVSRIQELEGELLKLKNLNRSRHRLIDNCDSDEDEFHSKNVLFPSNDDYSSDYDFKVVDVQEEIADQEKEQEHSTFQEKLDRELKELDKKLEQKEAEMKRYASGDNTSVLKQHYEKKVHELEQEKKALQREIDELRHNLSKISSNSDDGAQKLKEDYLQKLNGLESQVSDLKKKQDAQAQLLRQKQKSDEAAKRLQDEIQRIKSQKVQLQHKIKQESEQFRLWKASREKEVLQLKKEGRRNEYEMHKLLALNQRQKMVLQRKTEEASTAAKRLKELLESRKASRETSVGNGNGQGLQALMQTIEHELEVTVRVHEVRSAYERQKEERAWMAKEVARLKEETEMQKQTNPRNCPETMSPGARNSRIYALENMLATSSSTLVSMASQLSEAEERERGFSGRGRWNHVRTLADAKNLMNYLFNLASSSRCSLRDKEVASREKDSHIRDLKEKIVHLNSLLKRSEMQKAELVHQVKAQNSALKKYATSGPQDLDANKRHKYDLRKQDHRSSFIVFEDMDTSESEKSNTDNVNNANDEEWIANDDDRECIANDHQMYIVRKRRSKKRNSKSRNQSPNNDQSSSKSDTPGEEANADDSAAPKPESGLCCSCSKYSSCKTNKCQCRSSRGFCGSSCGCVATKCANREGVIAADGIGEGSGSDEADKDTLLASQGAMLLESALAEKPTNEDGSEAAGPRRKPLSDIGNTAVKSNASKPNKRKKWRTSTIRLVTTQPPPPSSQPEQLPPLPPPKPDNTANVASDEADIAAVRLPRAMRFAAAAIGGNPFREQNAEKPADTPAGANKGSGAAPPPARSPVRRGSTAEEKENFGL